MRRLMTPDLKRVRDYFQLDSVAVPGNELVTIKRILTYIHDKIRHDGQNGATRRVETTLSILLKPARTAAGA